MTNDEPRGGEMSGAKPVTSEGVAAAGDPALTGLSDLATRGFADAAEAAAEILRLVTLLFGTRTGYIARIDPDAGSSTIVAARSEPGGCDVSPGDRHELGNTFCSAVADPAGPDTLAIEDVRRDAVWASSLPARALPEVGSYVSVAIRRSDGTLAGTLCAVDPEPRRFGPGRLATMRVLARLYATVLERDEEIERRRHAESALRQNDARFRAFVRNSPIPFWLKDDHGRYALASPPAEAAAPIPGGWIGRTEDDVFAPDVAAVVRETEREVQRTGQPYQGTELVPDEHGQPRYFHVVRFPVVDEAGSRHVGGFSIDVTAETELRQRLGASETWFRALIENATDVLMVMDVEATASFVNEAVRRVLGYEPAVFVEVPLPDLVHPDDLPRVPELLAGVVGRPGQEVRAELRIRHADGTYRWLDFSAHDRSHEPAISGIVVSARDATDRVAEDRAERIAADAAPRIAAAADADAARIAALATVAAHTGAFAAELWTPDEDGTLRLGPAWYPGAGDVRAFHDAGLGMRLGPGEGVQGAAWERQEPVWASGFVERPQTYRSREAAALGWSSIAAFPLAIDGAFAGSALFWFGPHGPADVWLTRAIEDALDRVAPMLAARERQFDLERNERWFRALIENSSDLLAVVDARGRHVFVSPSYGTLLGHRTEDVVGATISSLIHPEDVEREREAFARLVAAAGATMHAESRIRTADGGWRWVSFILRNRLDDPAVRGIVVNGRDVTERKEAERRQAVLASVVEGAAFAIFSVDRDGVVTAWNPAAETQYGIPAARVVGGPLPDLAAPGTEDPMPGAIRRVIAGEPPQRTNALHRGDASDPRAMGVTVSPVRAGAGGIIGASVTAVDITELVHAQQERERLAAQERAVLDAAGEAMILVSPEGVLLTANRAFGRWFDIDETELAGQPFAEIEPGLRRAFSDPEAFLAAFAGAVPDGGHEFDAGLTQTWPDRREIEASSTPVRAADGHHIGRLLALRDVSHERAVEAAKTEFVSLVSHELRTPLTSIKGYTDLLLEETGGVLDGEAREFLEIVGANADRLVTLVSGLLEMSRIESGRVDAQPEALALQPLAAQVIASMRPQIEARGQTVALEAAPDLPPAWADPALVTQILTNLLSNANKYTPEGGGITVRLSRDGAMASCAVVDTGIGMTPAETEQVFTRFFRASNQTTMATRGTGLGLSITRSLVELLGGTISVESAAGKGSTFTFTLPLALERASDAVAAAATETAAGMGVVLVVEDDPDTARLLRRVLERAGHHVLVATTGSDALDLAAVEDPALILLDIVLPDIDGMTVLGRLKADPDLAAIPVMVLSMLPDDGAGRRLGAVGYLAKPIDEAVLLERVGDAVHPDRDQLLVADDDPALRRHIATLLRRRGFSVLEAADGEEAVAIALRERPAMVLLDIRMPGMGGIEALHALRDLEETHDVPVVMMTASPTVAGDAREEIEELGISALLTKPITMDDLLAAIGSAVAGDGR